MEQIYSSCFSFNELSSLVLLIFTVLAVQPTSISLKDIGKRFRSTFQPNQLNPSSIQLGSTIRNRHCAHLCLHRNVERGVAKVVLPPADRPSLRFHCSNAKPFGLTN